MSSPENWQDFHRRTARTAAKLVWHWQEVAIEDSEGQAWEALEELTHYLKSVNDFADENF